jgi:hypothetical protein
MSLSIALDGLVTVVSLSLLAEMFLHRAIVAERNVELGRISHQNAVYYFFLLRFRHTRRICDGRIIQQIGEWIGFLRENFWQSGRLNVIWSLINS